MLQILRKHARTLMVVRLTFVPRAHRRFFITTTLYHRLAGLCSDRLHRLGRVRLHWRSTKNTRIQGCLRSIFFAKEMPGSSPAFWRAY